MLQAHTHIFWVSERFGLAGQHQRGTHDGFMQLGEHGLRYWVIGYADTDGFTLRMLQAPGYFVGSGKDEGIGARRMSFKQAVGVIIHMCIGGNLRQITAHQREVMPGTGATDAANALHSRFVPQHAPQGVTGIGGINDDPASLEDRRSATHQPQLRRLWMDNEILTHAIRNNPWRAAGGRCVNALSYPTFSTQLCMSAALEFLLLAAFFASYLWKGIFFATGVLMAGSVLVLAASWWHSRKLEPLPLAVTILALVLGGVTLVFHDAVFIKWKFSIVEWLFGVTFLATQFMRQTLIERMLSAQVRVPPIIWRRLNLLWAAFFLLLGSANVYVIYHFDTADWVKFKVWWSTGAMLIFVIAQALYMSRHIQMEKTS